MEIRLAQESDLQDLLNIYNYEVLNGTATLDLHAKTYEERKVWFDEHTIENHHPLLVAIEDDHAVGYASLSSYREKEAYKTSVELSIYVDVNYRRRGIASKLIEEILKLARQDSTIHAVVSVIISGNEASRRLHKQFKFMYCGTVYEVGKKFGRYMDIDNYLLILDED